MHLCKLRVTVGGATRTTTAVCVTSPGLTPPRSRSACWSRLGVTSGRSRAHRAGGRSVRVPVLNLKLRPRSPAPSLLGAVLVAAPGPGGSRARCGVTGCWGAGSPPRADTQPPALAVGPRVHGRRRATRNWPQPTGSVCKRHSRVTRRKDGPGDCLPRVHRSGGSGRSENIAYGVWL